MSDNEITRLGHRLYWLIVILGGILVLLFFYSIIQTGIELRQIEKVNDSDITRRMSYNELQPEATIVRVGEDVYFRSYREINNSTPLEYLDILWCNYRGMNIEEDRKIGEFIRRNPAPRVEKGRSNYWRLNILIPQTPAFCYLESTVTLFPHPKANPKSKTIISPRFEIQ